MIRIAALLAVLWAGSAAAQAETSAAAEAAANRIQMAMALLEAAQGSDDQIAALTETVQAFEDGLAALREGLRRVTIQRQTIEAELDAKSEEVAQLLGVLQAIDPSEAPLLLLHPSGALGTARAGMILADVTPAIQAQVEALRADLAELATLKAVQDGATQTLAEGLEGVQSARALLSQAVSDRTDLPRRFIEDPAATTLLLSSTETLEAFAAGLAQTVDEDLGGEVVDPATLRGGLGLPVLGEVIRRAGEADAAGVVRPGVIIATRPRALVTTPVAATVRFRGPLLDYGNVIILEPAAGVLFVIAGLAEVFGEAGQVLPAGAPIGLMGGEQAPVDGILTQSSETGAEASSETLYLEVRDGQGPVDPADWFALE